LTDGSASGNAKTIETLINLLECIIRLAGLDKNSLRSPGDWTGFPQQS